MLCRRGRNRRADALGSPVLARLAPQAALRGADFDMERILDAHLFVICANNSGSTFLNAALGTCRAVWRLPAEGQRMPGFRGPRTSFGPGVDAPGMIWAAREEVLRRFADADAYDWQHTRKAWYFQASASHPRASVFVTKSPPFLLQTAALSQHFSNARFLFMVRNPYAVCEGICRNFRRRFRSDYQRLFGGCEARLAETAAAHVVACMERQRRNIERWTTSGVFFTYEAMCAAPEEVAARIQALVPQLDDLELRQRLPVKGAYHSMLTDMNARQIERLSGVEVAALNRVFAKAHGLLGAFGYRQIDDQAAPSASVPS